jgi:hypothetical protein
MKPDKPNVAKYIETKLKNNDRIKLLMGMTKSNLITKTNILDYKLKKPNFFNKIIKKIEISVLKILFSIRTKINKLESKVSIKNYNLFKEKSLLSDKHIIKLAHENTYEESKKYYDNIKRIREEYKLVSKNNYPRFVDFDEIDKHNSNINENNPTLKSLITNDEFITKLLLNNQDKILNINNKKIEPENPSNENSLKNLTLLYKDIENKEIDDQNIHKGKKIDNLRSILKEAKIKLNDQNKQNPSD